METEQLTISNPCVVARLRPDKHPRLKSYPKDNAVDLIAEIIFKAYFYKGYKFDQDNVKALSETLYDEMMMDSHHVGMPQISIFEIGYAVKKAVMDNEDFFFPDFCDRDHFLFPVPYHRRSCRCQSHQ